MRKILSAFVIAVLAGSSLTAGEFMGIKNLAVDGSIEVRGDRTNNADDFNGPAKDTAGNTVTRIRVGLNADVTEGVTGRVEAVRNTAAASAGDNAFYGDSQSTVGGFADELVIHNAYGDLTEFLQIEKIRLGRQYLSRPGDLLVHVGPTNDDLLSVSSIDGLRLWESFGKIAVDAFTGKVNEAGNAAALATSGDVNVSFVRLSSDKLIDLGKQGVKIPLELGFYTGSNNQTAAASDDINLTIIDLRAGFQSADDKLKASLEYAQNGGQINTGPGTNQDFGGSAILLGGSYDDADRGFGVHASYANASGDKTALNSKDKSFRDLSAVSAGFSDYRYGEILSNSSQFNPGGVLGGAGLDTAAEGPGLNVINLGGMYRLPWMDGRLVAKGDYYIVKMNETGTLPDDVGNEIDLSIKYKHNNSVSASAGYAMLAVGDGVTASADDVTKLWAKIMMKWGGK